MEKSRTVAVGRRLTYNNRSEDRAEKPLTFSLSFGNGGCARIISNGSLYSFYKAVEGREGGTTEDRMSLFFMSMHWS